MFGLKELKERIAVTDKEVECPVKYCTRRVERQRGFFKKEDRYRCPDHDIYISPTTFEYSCESDNLLWKDDIDLDLLKRIMESKRESRMARDNSEDAVSWNVFRFMERNSLVDGFLSSATETPVTSSEVIYWSYSQKENVTWLELQKARREFGEGEERGSEPDIIVTTDNTMFFIEAKLTATNNTTPSDKDDPKKYEVDGESWFSKVFKTDFKTIAVRKKKYELMRFWLLGSLMADQQKKDFCLINLVRDAKERNIESLFKSLIRENERRRFMRITWEQIYEFICGITASSGRDQMIGFFKNKTIGYDGKGNLRPAFSVN
jgi:hypothetical protein